MKDIYIQDLKVGEKFDGFFMVKQVEIKKASNGRAYLDLALLDSTGEISGKKWDLADEEVESERQNCRIGGIIKVRAEVNEFKGMKQLRILKVRGTNKEDNIEIRDYIKAAPEEGEDMFRFLFEAVEAMEDEDLKALCLSQLSKNREKLLYWPAASKNHHAEMSGLLWHTKRMLESGLALCGVYTILDRDLLTAGIILHDMQKINEIDSNEFGISDGYSFEGNMLGHLVMGVRELEKDMLELGFDDEKRVMVEHMILSHHGQPDFGSPVKPLFPEAEVLHHLDDLDAKMYDMEDILRKTEKGAFSDRVWTLGRRVYRRKGAAEEAENAFEEDNPFESADDTNTEG